MDNVIFYLPSPASQSQPARVPRALAAAARSDQSIASSKHIDRNASQLDPHDEKCTISMSQHRDEKDSSPKICTSVPRGRTVGVDEQENLTAIQEFLRNAPGLLLDSDASLSSMQQTNSSASAIPISDSDDAFADIDEILSSIQSKSTSARAKPDTASKDGEVDYSSQSDTSVDSRRSAPGSTQNPIILSEDESTCIDSETDYSISDIDPTLESEAAFHPTADSELGVGKGLHSATTHLSRRRLVNDQDDDDQLDGCGPDYLRLAPHKRVAYQVSSPLANIAVTQASTDSAEIIMTRDVKDVGFNVHTEGGEDDHHALSATERSMPSADYNSNPAFHLQDDQHNHTHDSQLDPVAVSIHSSDIEDGHLARHTHRQEAGRDVPLERPKRLCTTASTGFASAPTTISTAFGSAHLEDVQSRVPIPSLDQGLILRNNGQDQCDNGTGSHNENNSGLRNALGPQRGRRTSWKQVGRATSTKYGDMGAAPTAPSLDSSQASAATLPGNVRTVQKSEDIPVQGYLTLRNIESKVEYCLTFSQELPHLRAQRQDRSTGLEESQTTGPATDPNQQWEIRKITGQKMMGLERHYRVAWKDTWVPESELCAARELVDAFKADHERETKSRKRQLEQDQPANEQQDARGECGQKRRRGRPRKQP